MEIVKSSIPQLPNCKIDKTHLELDDAITLKQCSDLFRSLETMEGAIQFWLGDCLMQTQDRFKDMAGQIALEEGLKRKTILEYIHVSRSVGMRYRNANLSWSHHESVAPLSDKDQKKWLELADEHKLTVRELRESIRSGKVVRLSEMSNESGRDSGLNIIHGAVMRVMLWKKNTFDKDQIKWTEQTVHELQSDVIRPLKELITELEAKSQSVLSDL